MTYEPPSTPTGPGRVSAAPAAPPAPTSTLAPVAPAAPARAGLMGLTWPITYVLPGAFVVFLVWLHRLWTSDRSAHNVYTRSTGIAVGGWFVPVANVVLGAYALRDLWHGTHNARRGVHDGPVDRSTPRLVTAWWFVALPAVLCAAVERVLRVGLSAPASVESLLQTLELYLGVKGVGNALFAGAAVLLALVVGRITAFTHR